MIRDICHITGAQPVAAPKRHTHLHTGLQMCEHLIRYPILKNFIQFFM